MHTSPDNLKVTDKRHKPVDGFAFRRKANFITLAVKHVKTRHAGLDPASRKYSLDTGFRRYDRLQYFVAGVITY